MVEWPVGLESYHEAPRTSEVCPSGEALAPAVLVAGETPAVPVKSLRDVAETACIDDHAAKDL